MRGSESGSGWRDYTGRLGYGRNTNVRSDELTVESIEKVHVEQERVYNLECIINELR